MLIDEQINVNEGEVCVLLYKSPALSKKKRGAEIISRCDCTIHESPISFLCKRCEGIDNRKFHRGHEDTFEMVEHKIGKLGVKVLS
jgi:hypothetical protein